ncbi:Rossmann-like and DUF2520 domain-containing protein [Parvicella tangerina]|uniref:DUF2520 domain-containing protein n=1 Tax=Parvicella tangerina TaxID=2829795 RepID=A0A916JMF9_9FLAO|nr:Rossmann-like and DUF2520 domain-containing protein [Parvicella tangerina]CAG5080740.1 hypothetical protein CRYO30217_01432 [Parvicella tangerina]
MRIVVIGSGNVATHLAQGLFHKGVTIDAIISRKMENAEALGSLVEADAFDNMKKYANWGKEDLVLIAVKDNAIDEVMSSGLLKHSDVVHTSGSYDSKGMRNYCHAYGAFYPFQTFRKTAAVDLSLVPFFLEMSSEKGLRKIEELACLLSNSVHNLNSSERKKLHLSGVFLNNFIYFILDKTKNLCVEHGISQDLLKPLLQQTIKFALDYPENLQTGPAKRGDVETMKGHIEVLSSNPNLAEIYKTLSYLIYNENHDDKIEL